MDYFFFPHLGGLPLLQELLLTCSIYHKPCFHFLARMDGGRFGAGPTRWTGARTGAQLEDFQVLPALDVSTPTLQACPTSPGRGGIQPQAAQRHRCRS